MSNEEIQALRSLRKQVNEIQAELLNLQQRLGALTHQLDVLSYGILKVYRGDGAHLEAP